MEYCIRNPLSAWGGNLVPRNSFVTATDYFEYLYPNKHVDKVFSVAYMSSALLVLVILMCLSRWDKLPGFKLRMNLAQVLFITALMVAPVMDWPCGGKGREIGYVMMIVALVVCGVADGLNMGSLVGATGELPGWYMQAVFAGNASSGTPFPCHYTYFFLFLILRNINIREILWMHI